MNNFLDDFTKAYPTQELNQRIENLIVIFWKISYYVKNFYAMRLLGIIFVTIQNIHRCVLYTLICPNDVYVPFVNLITIANNTNVLWIDYFDVSFGFWNEGSGYEFRKKREI